MKIVLSKPGQVFFPSGISVFIFELSNALIRAGHDVVVISGFEQQNSGLFPTAITDLKEMFEVKRLPTIITLDCSGKIRAFDTDNRELLLWLRRGSILLKQIEPDLLIANGAVPLRSSTLKVILCHDLEFRGRPGAFRLPVESLHKMYDYIIYRNFDVVAATSTELTQKVQEELKLKSKRVATLPVCIDTQKYAGLSLNHREHAILHIGTWHDKNLQSTVKAFCALARTDPELKLYVIGDIWEMPKRVLSKVKNRYIKRILCLGHISKKELMNLEGSVKVTSVPSIYKVPVLSPTVLESFAAGTPVVGSSTGISKDLLIDGYNGFGVDPNNPVELAEKIELLIKNEGLWREMSFHARCVAQKFDASAVADMCVNLYKKCRG